MASNPRYIHKTARNALRKRVAAMGLPCHLCGRPIDYTLPAGHPMSFELDELVPLAYFSDEDKPNAAVDPNNVAPAHLVCNRKRGKKLLVDSTVRGMRIKKSKIW